MAWVRVHHSTTSELDWDEQGNVDRLRKGADPRYYASAFAWRDEEKDGTDPSHYRILHHEIGDDGTVGAASVRAVIAGITALGSGDSGITVEDDIDGVYRHLAAHVQDAGMSVPDMGSKGSKGSKEAVEGAVEGKGSEPGEEDGEEGEDGEEEVEVEEPGEEPGEEEVEEEVEEGVSTVADTALAAKKKVKDKDVVPGSVSIEYKSIAMEVKELSDDGQFTGALSVYNVVDYGGDVVESGSMTKTIKDNGGKVVMCWQHKADSPIGVLYLSDTSTQLNVKGIFNLDMPDAQKAYSMMKFLKKHGLKMGLSIGFQAVKDAVENGVRRLKEIKLFEGSVVTFAMNKLCFVTDVKKLAAGVTPGAVAGVEFKGSSDTAVTGLPEEVKEFAQSLEAIQLRALSYQLMDALWESLSTNVYSGVRGKMTPEECVTACRDDISAFLTAYVDYVPKYIAVMKPLYGDSEYYSLDQIIEHKGLGRGLVKGLVKGGVFDSKSAIFQDWVDKTEIRSTIDNLKALLGEAATSGTGKGTEEVTEPVPELVAEPVAGAANAPTEPVDTRKSVDHSWVRDWAGEFKASLSRIAGD